MKPDKSEKSSVRRNVDSVITPPSPVGADLDTRERTLLAAARSFSRHGYSATTLREIAKAVNIKAGSVYYHFESKEQILDEVLQKGIDSVFAETRRRVDALPPKATIRERLTAAIEGHLWAMLNLGDFTSANIRIYGQIPTSARNRHRMARRAYADYWDRLLEEAHKEGVLRSDISTIVIRLFIIGVLNSTIEWYNPNKGSFKEFASQLTSLIFDGPFHRD